MDGKDLSTARRVLEKNYMGTVSCPPVIETHLGKEAVRQIKVCGGEYSSTTYAEYTFFQ